MKHNYLGGARQMAKPSGYTAGPFTVDEIGFIQIADAKVLAAGARGEIDLNLIAREELAAGVSGSTESGSGSRRPARSMGWTNREGAMSYQVSVRCSTGGWVFHFLSKEEAISYARSIRAGGNVAKIFKMVRKNEKEA